MVLVIFFQNHILSFFFFFFTDRFLTVCTICKMIKLFVWQIFGAAVTYCAVAVLYNVRVCFIFGFELSAHKVEACNSKFHYFS